jgi:hypothetical protein
MSGFSTLNANYNRIPGTDYTVAGTKDGGTVFVGKDGKEISQEQFLQKVATKEISLSAGSLTVLESWLGPDAMDSLRSSSGYQASPAQLLSKMGVSDALMGDIYTLLALVESTLKEQKKAMGEVQHLEQSLQLEFMKQGANEEMAAARVRAVMGFVSAAVTVASGAASGFGALKGMGMSDGAELFAKKWEGISTGISGAGKALDSAGGLAAAGHEQNSEEKDIGAKKMEQMSSESRDGLDQIREMHAKVMELLQTMNEVSKGAPRA